jgi:hypothetical protein
VNRLYHRKEARALRNDVDLPRRSLSNCGQGEMGSAMESVPAAGRRPDEETEWDEVDRRLEDLQKQVNELLGGDERAKDVFGCMCGGTLKNREIAAELGLKEKTVRYARRRVERKLAGFKRRRGAGNQLPPARDGLRVFHHHRTKGNNQIKFSQPK